MPTREILKPIGPSSQYLNLKNIKNYFFPSWVNAFFSSFMTCIIMVVDEWFNSIHNFYDGLIIIIFVKRKTLMWGYKNPVIASCWHSESHGNKSICLHVNGIMSNKCIIYLSIYLLQIGLSKLRSKSFRLVISTNVFQTLVVWADFLPLVKNIID